jgi:L-lysine 6-transaminase
MEKQSMPSNYPGPKSLEMIRELQRYVIVEPEPFAVDLEASRGMYLATVDGQRIFDWAGYYGSKLIGHNHPGLYEPEYLARLARAANNKTANPDFLTLECLEYYRLLHEIAPAAMRGGALEVYAVNSGAEAVENMMKYLLILHEEKLQARGEHVATRRFLYFEQAFHGRTVFALNITWPMHDPVITKEFQGFIPANVHVAFPSIDPSAPPGQTTQITRHSLEIVEDCLQRYGHEVVAVIVEPIQGAGGHRVATPEFFRGLSELTHKHDVYLGFDEVQTAGGQTGTMFAIDQFDLPHPPQAVAVAKKFANGAVYMLYPMKNRGILDSTWGGNLADMVRFVQEMKIVRRERLLEQVPEKTRLLCGTPLCGTPKSAWGCLGGTAEASPSGSSCGCLGGLNGLAARYPDLIFNVRGMGLYQGFSLRRESDLPRLRDIALQQENMLLLGAGQQTIRLRPMLDVTKEEIALMLEKLDRCLRKLQ